MKRRYFLDTNIVIGLLIDEKFSLHQKVRADLERVINTKDYIENLIDGDTIFLFNQSSLLSAFFIFTKRGMSYSDMADMLINFRDMSINKLFLETEYIINSSLFYASKHNYDYEDLVQYFSAKFSGCEAIITNDIDFPKLNINILRTDINLKNYILE